MHISLACSGGQAFDVTDNNGSTVLTVADDEASAGSAFPRRALMAGGVLLAKCGRAQPGAYLYRKTWATDGYI